MKKIHCLIFLFAAFLLLPVMVEAGMFSSSCDYMIEVPKPSWVEPGYGRAGFYTGVGMAVERKGFEELKKDSEQEALGKLAQNISVQIKSTYSENIRESSGKGSRGSSSDVSLSTEVRAEQLLRDVKVESQWLDRKQCILWTLVVIKKETVERIRKELVMKERLEEVKELLAKTDDRSATPDVKRRSKYLTDAERLLGEIDFAYLQGEMSREAYIARLLKARSEVKDEAAKTKGRTLIASLAIDGEAPEAIVGKILDHIKIGTSNADRLLGACADMNDCIRRAADRGFSRLAVVKVRTRVETTAMGALKGTLSVDKTDYDVESGKVLSGPDNAFAQVIAWSADDLNWDAAADKIISGGSMGAGK